MDPTTVPVDASAPTQTPTPEAPSPTPAAAVPDVSALAAQIEALTALVGKLSAPAPAPESKPTPIPTVDPALEQLRGQLAGSAKRAALAGIKSDTYLALAPTPVLDATGALTPESSAAMVAFRRAHPDLFNAPTGTTPTGVAGTGDDLTPAQQTLLRTLQIDPVKTRETLSKSSLASVIGWAPPQSKQAEV
jgi:hypothetical protein